MGRKSSTTAKQAALEMDEGFQSSSRLWARLRHRFPRAVREMVDIVAELGGVSLHDIELLQVAQLERLEARIKRLEKRPQTSTAIAALESLKLQCLKHLRTIRVVASPIATPNEAHHPEPEELELRRKARASLAARMSSPPAIDTGVELN